MANLSPAEEASAKMKSKLRNFLQEQKSKNTQYKTKSDLNAWKKFCESLKESRAIENIPANELDLPLSKFFIYVRKQNGTEYEPTTKTRLLQPNSMTQTRRRFLISPLERPVLDDFSEGDVQPNFVAQLSGHKNLKILDSYDSASLKRQREMSAILNREPGTSAQSEENQVSTSNKSSLRQFLPERVLTSSKVAHLTSTFSVVIGRRSQG